MTGRRASFEGARRFLDGLSRSPLINTRVWDEDHSFRFFQETATADRKIFFGPLETSIDDLMWRGWFLEGCGFLWNRVVTVRLCHRDHRDQYKLYKLNMNGFSSHAPHDLVRLIQDGKQMIGMASVSAEKDPMDALLEKYPVKKTSKKTLVGNMTVAEFLL